jgi:hypothetical protein
MYLGDGLRQRSALLSTDLGEFSHVIEIAIAQAERSACLACRLDGQRP